MPGVVSVACGGGGELGGLAGVLPGAADYRAAPLCTGDADDLVLRVDDMPGEKIAKVKVGLYEAGRDGMVVNLLLEAIPDLPLLLDAHRAWTPLHATLSANLCNPGYPPRIPRPEHPCHTRDDAPPLAA